MKLLYLAIVFIVTFVVLFCSFKNLPKFKKREDPKQVNWTKLYSFVIIGSALVTILFYFISEYLAKPRRKVNFRFKTDNDSMDVDYIGDYAGSVGGDSMDYDEDYDPSMSDDMNEQHRLYVQGINSRAVDEYGNGYGDVETRYIDSEHKKHTTGAKKERLVRGEPISQDMFRTVIGEKPPSW